MDSKKGLHQIRMRFSFNNLTVIMSLTKNTFFFLLVSYKHPLSFEPINLPSTNFYKRRNCCLNYSSLATKNIDFKN